MNRRNLMQLSGLASAATLLAGCFGPDAEWHRKITVTVQTPSGEKSAFAVHAESLSKDPVLGSAHASFVGEAVVLEVSAGKYLFALIQENKPQTELVVFPGEAPLVSTHKLSAMVGKIFELSPDKYPMLVTFDNINDPKSVKEVKPSDLAGAFGTGYALKSITLEITDEKVTEGVVRRLLPWLSKFPEPPLCEPKSGDDFSFCAAKVHHGDFVRGQS
jgi:TAT (twin-arginine translocation) pathway signal sequence